MKAKKRHTVYILSFFIAALSITSCSSVGDLPKDDVYYSRNTESSGEYNWDDFQKNSETYGSKTITSNVEGSDSYDYNTSYQDDVAIGETSGEDYEYIDEYYDGSYESRLERFGSNGSNTNFGYYDDYYTGYNNCYSCNSGPTISFGFGMGMGYGYGMSYGYGWPYYSYYPSWYYPYYYPSYYYPYYGYNSYWSGYNAGYNAGYWNGYYGYPYGGGYYNDYGYGSAVAYGPRNSRVGGTNIPRNRNSGSGGSGVSSQKSEVVSGGAINPIARDGSTVASRDGQATNNRDVSGSTVRIGKPDSDVTYRRDANTQSVVKSRSGTPASRQPEKVYQKPKSYQNLSTQQTKSRSEYVRPTNKTKPGTANQSRTTNVRPNPTTPRDINTSGSNRNNNIYQPSKNRSSSYERSTQSKSYSSPSRTNTSPRSYSSPSTTRSSGGGGKSSVGSSRSSNVSSGSSSRSSGSGSSSRSSGSSSRGGGGSPGRR